MTKQEALRYLIDRVPENEPVFILRGRDRLAPLAIHDWARRVEGCADPDREKIRGALDVAEAMDLWKGEKKLPGRTKAEKVFKE